jgi:SAM-dependent methyltransferase
MHEPDQVLRVLERGPKPARIFEGSCGEGRLTRKLAARGYQVVCTTFASHSPLEPSIHCLTGVDLNRRFPVDDGEFDAAILQEVFEHLENPAHTIREFNRILRLGGRWILTTPNAHCLRSRLHFLLSGFVKGRRRAAGYDLPPGDYQNLFIPLFGTLHYLLWSYGFRVARTGRSRWRLSSLLLLAPLFPFVWIWTWYYTRSDRRYQDRQDKRRDTPVQREASRNLRRLLLSLHFLLDENLVLDLEKVHGIEHLYNPEAPATRSGRPADSTEPAGSAQ